MSETPFRVDSLGQRPMVRVNDRPFETFEENIRAHERADDLNDAWSAAGGPALTRQRDELAEAVRQTLGVFHEKCSDYDHASWNPDAHIEVTLTIADLRRLAAAIGGG